MFEQAPGDSEGQEKPGMLQSTGSQIVRLDWLNEQQRVGHNLAKKNKNGTKSFSDGFIFLIGIKSASVSISVTAVLLTTALFLSQIPRWKIYKSKCFPVLKCNDYHQTSCYKMISSFFYQQFWDTFIKVILILGTLKKYFSRKLEFEMLKVFYDVQVKWLLFD